MKSLLAGLLMLVAAVALLAKQLLLFVLLAPLAWVAATWAGKDHDDIGTLMGACLMIGVALTLAQCAGVA